MGAKFLVSRLTGNIVSHLETGIELFGRTLIIIIIHEFIFPVVPPDSALGVRIENHHVAAERVFRYDPLDSEILIGVCGFEILWFDRQFLIFHAGKGCGKPHNFGIARIVVNLHPESKTIESRIWRVGIAVGNSPGHSLLRRHAQ